MARTIPFIVKDFINAKWVAEYPHPEDGRKELLRITPGHDLANGFEKSFQSIMNKPLRQYVDGKLIRVSAAKKSY